MFLALTGETLNDFVKRLRLEKALSQIAHHRRQPLTGIALACGFASMSDFSRCFKHRHGVPPSRFDLAAHRASHRQERGATVAPFSAGPWREAPAPGANPDGFVATLRHLPARSVAYLRVHDSFREGAVADAAQRLMQWADQQGVGDHRWLGYMWDDPALVALKDCRYDVAVKVARSAVKPGGEIGRFDFPALLVAQEEVRYGIDLELRALDWLYGSWLPGSGHVPADWPCFEAWLGRPVAQRQLHVELDIWLPIQRA